MLLGVLEQCALLSLSGALVSGDVHHHHVKAVCLIH